jgi:hypothetical protein
MSWNIIKITSYHEYEESEIDTFPIFSSTKKSSRKASQVLNPLPSHPQIPGMEAEEEEEFVLETDPTGRFERFSISLGKGKSKPLINFLGIVKHPLIHLQALSRKFSRHSTKKKV